MTQWKRVLEVSALCMGMVLSAACGDDAEDEQQTKGDGGAEQSQTGNTGSDNVTDGMCNEPSPKDAFTADNILASGMKVTCYYAPPLGYCVEINDPALAADASKSGKGAIGCKDAIVRSDEACPMDTAIGKCEGISGFAKSETRVYYPCNQYSANPALVSPEESCKKLGGTYTAL